MPATEVRFTIAELLEQMEAVSARMKNAHAKRLLFMAGHVIVTQAKELAEFREKEQRVVIEPPRLILPC